MNKVEESPSRINVAQAWTQLSNDGYLDLYAPDYTSTTIERNFLQSLFDKLLPDPYGPMRKRAHCKFDFNVSNGVFALASEQEYTQTTYANPDDGGLVRTFEQVPTEGINAPAFVDLFLTNMAVACSCYSFSKEVIRVGVHFVRYVAKPGKPSFSSPLGLHRDDEPLVFLNVINESTGLIGGDSILAESHKNVTRVCHLTPFQGILLTRDLLHAVSPIGVPPDQTEGYRDIVLITIEEPDDTIKLKAFQ